MPPVTYPGGLSELAFLESYHQSALRKPQVVADSALRAIVLASAGDRMHLVAVVAEQLAEAARRLAHVAAALADRRYPVARTLAGPLPDAPAWLDFAHTAATLAPEQMLRHLSIGEYALESAERLRSQLALEDLIPLVRAAESGPPMLLAPRQQGRSATTFLLLGPASDDGAPPPFGMTEDDAGVLADLTADLSSIARGFLGAYLESRHSAGRRDS
ncbi:MAG: hypothetical protein ACSLFM_01630 [Tepidiformaceae bacterium]